MIIASYSFVKNWSQWTTLIRIKLNKWIISINIYTWGRIRVNAPYNGSIFNYFFLKKMFCKSNLNICKYKIY